MKISKMLYYINVYIFCYPMWRLARQAIESRNILAASSGPAGRVPPMDPPVVES